MKLIRKASALLLCLAFCFALTACGENTGKSEKVVLIGADSTGKGAAGQLLGEYIAKRVSELTNGTLEINYHPNGELGGDADLLRQTQNGDIALMVCQTAPMVSFIPEMAVFDLPLSFASYDADTIDRALNGDNDFTKALREAYEAKGFEPLGFLQSATYRLTTANRPLNNLEDFKGLQIRTMENSNHMAFWAAIGAEPTPLAWAEVYGALQNGTIDAQENAADTCVGANFQDVQKYLACTDHILYCNQICVSSKVYEKLSEDHKAALQTAAKEAIAYMRPQLTQMDLDNKKLLTDGGMTLIEYEDSFYTELLGLPGVTALYEKINAETGGLTEKLQAVLRG